jgi:polyhydroxybutyrate depolymerase
MHRLALVLLLFACGLSQGVVARDAPGERVPDGFVAGTFVHDGATRRYLLHAPAGGATPTAVLLVLHGHGSDPAQVVGPRSPGAAWAAIADRERWLLVVPQGLAGPDGRTGWNDCRGDAGTNPDADDAGFLRALSASLERERGVRQARHYVVGTSNGGMMALRMAIESPAWTTAIAAIVASLPARSECTAPRRAVPVMLIDGTADPLVPFEGGEVGGRFAGGGERGTVLAAMDSARLWARLADADASPATVALPDRDPDDGSTVTQSTWTTRDGRPAVRLLRVDGGGHTEPGIAHRYPRLLGRLLGAQNGDVESADAIRAFFAAQ